MNCLVKIIYISFKYMVIGPNMHIHSSPNTMGFKLIVSNLEFDIFTYAPTFNQISIGDHDLNFLYRVYKTMGFFCHSLVNEIMSTSTVN
jgi:hypothetical protein